jgi:CRISPR/Cas system-associated exonuclease Cas4 (RecB family)
MLNYQEYCALVRQLRDAHLKEIKAAKNNVALEEENHEYLLVNKYMTALRKTFDEMDLKKEGVVSRVDLIKLIRSEHPKLLHLPVSTSSGAATVN